jgi:predicted CoA-binding protein
MKDIAALLDEPDTTVAVVGATDESSKYGHRIYMDLKRKGFKVFPVNAKRPTVDGDEAFASLEAIPTKPTIVNIVVPPKVTLGVLRKCLALGLSNVWVQPGAEDTEVMNFLEANGFNFLANACIMIQSRMKE